MLVVESMELFKNLPLKEKDKIYFIHLNHTNPLLNPDSGQTKPFLKAGSILQGITTYLNCKKA
ncbi:hypothetical protein CS542_03815 [Pedobacter sp. IW39]|nr:hypothetical protein CS542_03815 [Pedobacter sp. IW39]